MRLIPYNKSDLRMHAYRKTKNYSILMEFINSDMECAKLPVPKDRAYQYASSFRRSIKNFNLYSIRVAVRKSEVFLVKMDADDPR